MAELAEQADVVITVGCGDACPYIPGKRYVDWDLPTPRDRSVDLSPPRTVAPGRLLVGTPRPQGPDEAGGVDEHRYLRGTTPI
jgi:hypothetical protein